MKRKVMSKSNRIFYIVNTVLLMICLLLVAMPILNVVASSLSSPSAVIRGQVSFWPKGWNIDAYEEIFSNRSLLTGYKNSIIYTYSGNMRKYCIDNYGGISIVRKGFYWKKGDQRSVYFRYDLHSTVDSYLSECQKPRTAG